MLCDWNIAPLLGLKNRFRCGNTRYASLNCYINVDQVLRSSTLRRSEIECQFDSKRFIQK